MTWANEDPDRLHTPTWYGLKSALMSPPSLVEGGGEWPHLPDWVPEVYIARTRATYGIHHQGINTFLCDKKIFFYPRLFFHARCAEQEASVEDSFGEDS